MSIVGLSLEQYNRNTRTQSATSQGLHVVSDFHAIIDPQSPVFAPRIIECELDVNLLREFEKEHRVGIEQYVGVIK